MTKKLEIRNTKDAPEVLIYDEIGPDWAGMVSGMSMKSALVGLAGEKNITVRVNSPGGDVFEGFAIYNALAAFPGKVRIHVDALAASAASVIAMSGDTIEMAANSMMMIHNCWVMAAGNAEELTRLAGVCAKVDTQIIETYAARSGQTAEKLSAMLAAETWMTAQEAIDLGFADKIGQSLKVSASVDQRFGYKNVPEQYRTSGKKPQPVETPLRIAASHRLQLLKSRR